MSDQDFFFDEDEAPEQKPAEKAASKGGTARKSTAAPSPKKAASTPVAGQTVTMTVAGLIGVVALLVGIIIGIVIPVGGSQPATPQPAMPIQDSGQARPLSPEEMGGDLPPGHPPLDDMGGGMAAPETETVDPADGGETE